jgi:hypothetical protein
MVRASSSRARVGNSFVSRAGMHAQMRVH